MYLKNTYEYCRFKNKKNTIQTFRNIHSFSFHVLELFLYRKAETNGGSTLNDLRNAPGYLAKNLPP